MRLSLWPLAAALLIASGTRLPAPETSARASTDSVRIYLLADSLHTGLVFELRWLEERGYLKPEGIGDHKYVAMSWGDQVAYVQKRWLTPGQICRALFSPTPSVMECIPFDWKVEEVCPHQRVYVAEIPESSGTALAAFLNSHTERSGDGTPLTIGPSSWGDGRLIRCPDHLPYDISRTCNHWTADALAAAGLSVDTSGILTVGKLVGQSTAGANGFRLIWDPARRRNAGVARNATGPGIPSDPPLLSDRGSCR